MHVGCELFIHCCALCRQALYPCWEATQPCVQQLLPLEHRLRHTPSACEYDRYGGHTSWDFLYANLMSAAASSSGGRLACGAGAGTSRQARPCNPARHAAGQILSRHARLTPAVRLCCAAPKQRCLGASPETSLLMPSAARAPTSAPLVQGQSEKAEALQKAGLKKAGQQKACL